MYPIFKEFDNLLLENDITELYNRSNLSLDKLNTAEIFINETKKNIVDKNIRNCKEIYLDNNISNWLDSIITPKINKYFNDIYFINSSSKSRIIYYEENEFFAKHTDVINIDSNYFKNYSLLINLIPCEEGGETVLYINEKFSYYSNNTSKKPGAGLIFPKSTLHEGLPIKKGKKLILFMNYFCYKKEKDYIIVNIEENGEIFVLPVEILEKTNSIYNSFYHFEKTNNLDKHIFYYNEKNLNSEEFKIFYEDLFDKCKYEFENYDIIKKKMDYLCYDLKFIKNFDFNLKPLELDNFKIVNENNGLFSQLSTFNSKIITIEEYVFVEYLYINDKLIFCHPNIIYERSGDDIRTSDHLLFHKDHPYDDILDCEICLKNENLYIFGDFQICIDCLHKSYNYYLNKKTIEEFFINTGENLSDKIYERNYIKNFIDCLIKFIESWSDEKNIGSSITSQDEDYGRKINPKINFNKKNKITDKIDNKLKNYIKSNNSNKYKNINIPQIVFDVVKLKNFNTLEKDTIPAYAGKNNYEVIYQTVIKTGVINLSKYKL